MTTIFIGRLTHNPEPVRIMNKDAVRVVLSNNTIDFDGNEITNYRQMYVFGGNAEIVKHYLKKSDLVCVEGTLDINQNIVAKKLTLLTSRSKKEAESC